MGCVVLRALWRAYFAVLPLPLSVADIILASELQRCGSFHFHVTELTHILINPVPIPESPKQANAMQCFPRMSKDGVGGYHVRGNHVAVRSVNWSFATHLALHLGTSNGGK